MINLLTLVRVVLLFPLAWVLLMTRDQSWTATVIFIAATMTDLLDGYLARRLNKVSLLGAMLDQICDKIFIIGTLVAMAAAGLLENLMLIPVFLIITREFAVAGLREYAALQGHSLPVDKFGKIKTVLQFFAMTLILIPVQTSQIVQCNQDGMLNCILVPVQAKWLVQLNHIGAGLLWFAMALGIISAVRYAISAVKSP